MELEFAKLNGLGNDFVFIDDRDCAIELTEEQVQQLCDRHFGIGGDGVIMVRPSELEDCVAFMHYINSDGSLAEMCGNGIRCFAKYMIDRKLVDVEAGPFVVETRAGRRGISFEIDADGLMTLATIDMGEPILEPVKVPTTAEATTDYQGTPAAVSVPLDSPWGIFTFTMVSMGNPHAVCFFDSMEEVDDAAFTDPANKSLDTFKLDEIGQFFESHHAFPAKANIEFALVGENGITMRVYERGDGETLACGTGACATNVASNLTGRAGRVNDLLLRGGKLHIEWLENNHVLMTGPAAQSFTGTVEV